MSYKEIIKDPILVAIIAAFIGLFMSHLYDLFKQNKKRVSGLKILKHQLENQERQLRELRTNLGNDNICHGLDVYAIQNFINSDIIDISKDESLITLLNNHLDNIESIKAALNIAAMRSAGFTSVHHDQQVSLENNLRNALQGCIDDIYKCINEIPA